jgi:oligoendopeptidase F
MAANLPPFAEIKTWTWAQFEPYYKGLTDHELSAATVAAWLHDWSALTRAVGELRERLMIATTVNTADTDAEQALNTHMAEIFPAQQAAEQILKQKLLDSNLEPEGFAVPLRNMRGETALFREANLPLFGEERKISNDYDKIRGAQTINWEGQDLPTAVVPRLLQTEDREVRERVWRLSTQRQLKDKDALDKVWGRFLGLRGQLAGNAGFSNYRDFRWRQLLRFDYTPDDCRRFHKAVEEVVVPAVSRILDRYRQRLGVDKLRPWDVVSGVPLRLPALKPFTDVSQLESGAASMFNRVDPQLGAYFQIMRDENLLDLGNRKNKAPGGYCTYYYASNRAFIFMNSVGLHQDVTTLLHEGGHAFHSFEMANLPYYQQQQIPAEFAEVASMSMEFLASPYFAGTFYSEADAAKARIQHLEVALSLWPTVVMVDAYQHWVYENMDAAVDPAQCDAKWIELVERYTPRIDYSGLKAEQMLGRHAVLHIFHIPFYVMEYALAQLGAMQIWANALNDQAGAVAAYRKALSLGYTEPLPKLFETAGAKFTFDADTLRRVVDLAEQVIEQLEVTP